MLGSYHELRDGQIGRKYIDIDRQAARKEGRGMGKDESAIP